MGRPSKLTPEVTNAIARVIADGVPQRTAAALAGVSESALQNWLKAGRDGVAVEYVQFLERVKKARAEAVAVAIANINRASRRDWRAAAWWLARMHPDEYGSDRRRVRELAKLVESLERQLSSGTRCRT